MKKITAILCAFTFVVMLFAGCGEEGQVNTTLPTEPKTTATTEPDASKVTEPSTDATTEPVTQPTTIPDVTTPTNSAGLPEYVPGSILLVPQNKDMFKFDRKYREVYYTIKGGFEELLTEEEEQEWYNWCEETRYGLNLDYDEMLLVTMIKRYDISREEFDKVVANYVAFWDQYGMFDRYPLPEEYEVYNGDIIYTFDNEIINHYYRYE